MHHFRRRRHRIQGLQEAAHLAAEQQEAEQQEREEEREEREPEAEVEAEEEAPPLCLHSLRLADQDQQEMPENRAVLQLLPLSFVLRSWQTQV